MKTEEEEDEVQGLSRRLRLLMVTIFFLVVVAGGGKGNDFHARVTSVNGGAESRKQRGKYVKRNAVRCMLLCELARGSFFSEP